LADQKRAGSLEYLGLRIALLLGQRQLTMEMYKWEIMLVRPRGRILGVVEAPDRETAIKVAIEEFKITDPQIKKRLTAHRIG
jgi:hypothetical protein